MDSASIKRVGIEKAQNFMRQYRDPESRELKKLSANQFMDVWSHYDKDGKNDFPYFFFDFRKRKFIDFWWFNLFKNSQKLSVEKFLSLKCKN